MTKDTPFTDKPPTHSETMRELFSEKKESFIDALECLYIRKNQGGRLMFAEKWPAAADKIFSEELVRYDYEGIKNDEDRQRRAELEEESELLREQMLDVFHNIESRLVIYGSLQVEELDGIMAQIDRPVAEYVFTDRFVEKYFPKPEGEESGVPTTDTPENTTERSSNPEPAASAPSPSGQAEETAHKEMVEVPDVEINSIGHVDHSFSTSTPTYKKGENGEDSEDMSWLDASEEDEFGGVQPISTEGATPPQASEPLPQDDVSAPKEMGLKAHQDNHGDAAPPSVPPPLLQDDNEESEAGLFDSVRKENDDQQPAEGHNVDQGIDVPEAPSIDEPSRGQSPETEEAPRRPMGMDGVRQAQEEQRRPPEPPPAQPQPTNKPADAPPPRPPMGMGAARPALSEAPASKPEDQITPESGAPSVPDEKKEEKPAPRVPSLDDIDNHMSRSGSESGSGSSNEQSGFPPIPGSDDDR